MRWTLMHKYVGSLFGALITCCGIVLFVSIYYMKVPIEDELDKGIRRMCQVVHMSNESTAQRFAQSAALIADEDSLARAIAEKDHETVSRLGKAAMEKANSDFMTITDATGVVVGRGHSAKYGDSVLKQETVVKALKGQPAVAVVAGTVVPFTLRASQPVMYEGRLVGSISIGVSLVDPAYMDWLGKVTGSHVTIFKGDTRVMTTIVRDGKRVIGTKLESKDIVKAVLERGETVFAHNTILGVPYNSAYWPVKAADGKTVGMWFVGMPIDVLRGLEKTAIQKAVMVGCALLAFQLTISFVLGRMVGAPVARITSYAQAVAAGKDNNLTLDVHSHDDMGLLADSLRSMEANLRNLVSEAAAQAEEARKKGAEAEKAMAEAREAQTRAESARQEGMVNAAAQIEGVVDQLNASINDMAARVENTAKALDHAAARLSETATAMEEMNSTVLEVAKNAGGAADVSNATKNKAESGATIVSQAVSSIQEVQRQSLALKEGMNQLDEHARAISHIMGVISDIADQTNLLALNAAIEAARAGDAGRGFAVVADEVRKLAEKTMASTTDVGNAIHAIQESAGQSIGQADVAAKNIAEATDFSNKSGEALNEIVGMVEQTADEVRAIATASEEQSSASEEINRSIADVNQIAAATSADMRAVNQELDALREQARNLVGLIETMKKA